jgi:hypothetical protein
MEHLRDVNTGTVWAVVDKLRSGDIRLAMRWDFNKVQKLNLEVDGDRSPISDDVIAVLE